MIARRLVSALLIALLVSGVFTFWLSRKFSKPHAAAAPAKQLYVAAIGDLEAGEVLKPTSVKLIEWPMSTPLQGAFTKPEEVAGRAVLYPLGAGEPILERQLAAVGSGAGLSAKIPEGMRAISLRSDQVVGVAGFLLPGTRVDVLVTYKIPPSQDSITTIVLQNVEVLAAGQKTQPDPEGKANTVDVVTLLVKPQDAEKAVLATAQGSVHFVLRNGSDHQEVNNSPVQLSQLGGGAPPATHIVVASPGVKHEVTIPTQPSRYAVETVAGGKQTVDNF